jgi:hypothetical protein
LITAVDVEHKRYRPAAAVGSLETVENNGKGRCLVLLGGALSLIAAFVKGGLPLLSDTVANLQ